MPRWIGMNRVVPNTGNRRSSDLKMNRGRRRDAVSLVTANVTGWESAKNYIRQATADILMLQEVKASTTQAEGFKEQARQIGYAYHATPATGDLKHKSAGALIAWKRHMAVQQDRQTAQNERCATVTLTTREMGEVTIGSIYLNQGDPFRDGSPAESLMQQTFAQARDFGTRMIVGGDYNQNPATIQQWIIANEMPLTVMYQEKDTFVSTGGRSNIDFFVVSQEVASVLDRPQIVRLSGLAGHSPVTTRWERAIFQAMVKVWKRPLVCHRPRCTGP